MINLVQIGVRETSNPFSSWTTVFLEPCSDSREQPGALPCWPNKDSERTQELLARLSRGTVQHRSGALLEGARYLARDIGIFRQAWIVGTDPLVVAFLDGPPDQIPIDAQKRLDQLRNLQTHPTTRPGVIEIVTRSGESVVMDLRARDARFVTKRDLETKADTLLLFPENANLRAVDSTPSPATQNTPCAKVINLQQAQTLDSILQALTRPEELKRLTKSVVEVPFAQP